MSQIALFRSPPRSWTQSVSATNIEALGGVTVTGTTSVTDSGAGGHLLSTNGATRPSASAGAALGTGGPIAVGMDPLSTDLCQRFTAVAGSTPGPAGVLATINFGAAYPPASIVMPKIDATNSNYWSVGFGITNVTTSGYSITVTSPLSASVSYGFNVFVAALAPPVIPVSQPAARLTATSSGMSSTTGKTTPPGIYTKSIVLATP